MEKLLLNEMMGLIEKNLKAKRKTKVATKSKERAQKTLNKAKKAEKYSKTIEELSLTKIKLLCSENNLDFDKTIKEIQAKLNPRYRCVGPAH